MTQEEIIDAGIEFTMANNPVCMGGDAFYEHMREFNRNKSFEAGAKWVLEQLRNIDEQKLDDLAEQHAKLHWTNTMFAQEILECKRDFKAGYKKALNL